MRYYIQHFGAKIGVRGLSILPWKLLLLCFLSRGFRLKFNAQKIANFGCSFLSRWRFLLGLFDLLRSVQKILDNEPFVTFSRLLKKDGLFPLDYFLLSFSSYKVLSLHLSDWTVMHQKSRKTWTFLTFFTKFRLFENYPE